VVRDRSDSRFEPREGYILHLEAEYGDLVTGSDFGFVRVIGELRAYEELAPGLVLASRIRPGWAHSIREPADDLAPQLRGGLGLHPQKRFFAGGPNSVRGFAQHRLGPKILWVDAERLVADTADGGAGCALDEIHAGTCDPHPAAERAFDPRPIGGAGLLEGSLELRFPVTPERLRGAAFLDFGHIWTEDAKPTLANLAWTPGAGLRYISPIGPVRVDVGYNTSGGEWLDVITTGLERDEDGTLVPTAELLRLQRQYDWRPRGSVLDRLQLHISIGQAF
jgi:outer membrane protein insertion porin family